MGEDDPFSDDGMVSISDAASIGYKIVEMADRARTMGKAVPGAVAKWSFEIDGVNYEVRLRPIPVREIE